MYFCETTGLASAECGVRSAELPKAVASGFKVRVTEDMTSRLADFVDKKIMLGIRPENITDTFPATGAKSECTVAAVAEVIEPVGAETYLYAATGAHSFVGRIHAGHRVAVKQSVSLMFDMSRAHFFDPEMEKVVGLKGL